MLGVDRIQSVANLPTVAKISGLIKQLQENFRNLQTLEMKERNEIIKGFVKFYLNLVKVEINSEFSEDEEEGPLFILIDFIITVLENQNQRELAVTLFVEASTLSPRFFVKNLLFIDKSSRLKRRNK